nr:uncharacterized protein LOC113741083 [Coffea arabica]
MVKYRHPIPRLDDMLDELHGAIIFTKIDLKMVYFDDILIYSRSLEGHPGHFKTVFEVLRRERLYANLKMCTFCTDRVVFLGYVVSAQGIHVDEEKVQTIQEWPTPTSVRDVRNFHGLASFYRRFVKDFSTIAAPLIAVMKKNEKFFWGETQDKAFQLFKHKLTHVPLLAIPNFDLTFEVECDASGVGIGAVLMQGGKSIAYFSEKLNGAVLNYLTYGKEMFVLVSALETWHHYLRAREFVIKTDHESLKYLKGQQKLNAKLLGFELMKELYKDNLDFSNAYANWKKFDFEKFFVRDGFLFYLTKLCIPRWSIRDLLAHESHSGGLMGHFGVTKTLAVLQEHFHWPRMRKDVERIVERYGVCHKAKSRVNSNDDKKKAEFVRSLHDKVRINIERRTAQYVQQANKHRRKLVFEPGDWVWLHLHKERFSKQRQNKLSPSEDGPFQVIKRINNNAYCLDLPGKYNVSVTFNVSDLNPFLAGDEYDLRANSFQEEGNDAIKHETHGVPVDSVKVPQDPVTQARGKRFKESLQVLVHAVQIQEKPPIEGIELEDLCKTTKVLLTIEDALR